MGRNAFPNEIDTSTVEAVERLLLVGNLNVAEIAIKIGVSRNTVYSIANGSHPSQVKGPVYTWCTGCGADVTKPCVLCAARAEKKGKMLERTRATDTTPKRQ